MNQMNQSSDNQMDQISEISENSCYPVKRIIEISKKARTKLPKFNQIREISQKSNTQVIQIAKPNFFSHTI